MRSVYYVPGFSASELWLDPQHVKRLWVDYAQLALRTPGALQLEATGTGPGGSYGVELYVGAPLTPYWKDIDWTLRRQLAGEGYFVEAFTWDWRKDIYHAGAQLAEQLAGEASSVESATLIGHSAGGLVCRAAWHLLHQLGRQSAIRRIITIGTPHWGTYYAVATWAGITDFVVQLALLGQTTSGWFGSWFMYQLGAFGAAQIVDVALTFPALYQLLPLVNAGDQAGDPHRPLLYDGGEWHGLPGNISQQHLSAVLRDRDAWLNDPTSHPPSWVMTAVSGTGFPTPATLAKPELLGSAEAMGLTNAGDSVVTQASAEADYATVVRLTGKHSDLPNALARSGQLAELVLDERTPATPALPPLVQTTPIRVELGGPPIPAPSFLPAWSKTCPRGVCTC